MVSPVLKTVLLLPLLGAQHVLAQNVPEVNAFGSTGPSGYGEAVQQRFAAAARSPLSTNNATFPGFDFSVTPSLDHQIDDLRIDMNWTLQVNYSAAIIFYPNETTANTTQLISATVFDLKFPDNEPLPQQNNTNWTMCGHFIASGLKTKSSAADETGDCTATLGESCLKAYRQAWLDSSLSSILPGCPDAPVLENIDECKSFANQGSGSGSAPLMSWSPAGASPGNYTGPRYGLNSTQPILARLSRNYNESDIAEYFDEYAEAMNLVVFSFQPSEAFLTANGPYSSPDVSRDVQIVCQRAATEETVAAQGAASTMQVSTFLVVLVSMLVVIFQI